MAHSPNFNPQRRCHLARWPPSFVSGFCKHALEGPWAEADQRGELRCSSLAWTSPAQGGERLTWDRMQPHWRVHNMSQRGWQRALISRSDQNKWASDPTSFLRTSPCLGPTATRPFRTSPRPTTSPQGGRLQPWAHVSTIVGGFLD